MQLCLEIQNKLNSSSNTSQSKKGLTSCVQGYRGTTDERLERVKHQGTAILTNLLTAGGLKRVEDEPASLHADIVSQLRDFVVEGHRAPGSRIPERELCEKFGISRTPWEALKAVAAEELIELLPNRGARVRQFSEADIRNLFEVLSGLDFVAGQMACARITDDALAAIVDATANPVLRANFASFNSIVRRLRYSANLVRRDRLGDAMREHEQIIDALKRRVWRQARIADVPTYAGKMRGRLRVFAGPAKSRTFAQGAFRRYLF
jgi:DNA-binding GntR family transcriptional regulator